MSLLLAFESSARHLSFTRAAEELSLSQSAVSRHVQNLEALLEVELFQRNGRKLALTEIGALYLKEVGLSLGRLRNATLQAINHRQGVGSIQLAILPTVGSKWLLPRIHRFYEKHPGIQIHIHSRIGQFDMEMSGLDAVISNSADGQWPNTVAEKLLEEELVPVVSPALAATLSGRKPKDVMPLLLLQVEARPNVWPEWFKEQELPASRMRLGPVFELTSHLLQAVSAGVGIGLVARFLVKHELDSGLLVEACDVIATKGIDYYLFTATSRAEYPAVRIFRDWVKQEALSDRQERPCRE